MGLVDGDPWLDRPCNFLVVGPRHRAYFQSIDVTSYILKYTIPSFVSPTSIGQYPIMDVLLRLEIFSVFFLQC